MSPITPPPRFLDDESAGFLANHGGAVALALLGAVLSVFAYIAVSTFYQRDVRQLFDDEVAHLTDEILLRFQEVEQELFALRGMVSIKPDVSREEFQRYIDNFNSRTIKQSVHGYAILERVPREQLDAFVKTQQNIYGDYGFHQIVPNSEPITYPVKHIEPLSPNIRALGLDIGSEPSRRQALEEAIDTGKPKLTSQITLVQDQKKMPGFLMFVPVYDRDIRNASTEERRQALIAIVDAAILTEQLLAGATETTDNLLDFELFVGKRAMTSERLVFDADQHLTSRGVHNTLRRQDFDERQFFSMQSLDIAGRDFTLTITSTPEFEARHKTYTPILVSVIAALIACGLVLSLSSHSRARLRAEAMARAMTADLERLAVVARSTTNGVVFASADKKVTWVNEGFHNITGYTLEDCLGKTPIELMVCPQTDPHELQRLKKTLENGQVYKGEVLTRRKNGDTYWALLQVQPLYGKDGALTGYMGFETDIHDRKLAEEALRKNRDQFASLVNNIPGVTYRCKHGSGWEMLYLSAQMESLSGYPANDFIANARRTYESLVHREDLGQLQREIDLAISHGESWDIEYRIVRADGRTCWVRERGAAVAENDKVVCLDGFILDIDQRKRHEIQQQTSAELNRSLAALHIHPEIMNGEMQTAANLFTHRICSALGVSRASLWTFSDDHRTLISEAELDESTQCIQSGEVIQCDEFPHYFQHLREHVQIAADDVAIHAATGELLWRLRPAGISSVLHVAITAGAGLTGVICAEHTGPARQWAPNEISFMMSLATLAGNVISSAQKRHALRALEASEARLRGLFDLSPLGIALNDFESGAFLEVNDAIVQPSGYTKSEFLDLSYWDLTPREYESLELYHRNQLEKFGKYGPFEKEYRRKDGTRYPVLLNGMLITDSAGKKLIWSFVEDISARKINENALKELLLQLEKFFELSANFMCIANTDGRFIKVNDTFIRVLGYSEAELTRTPFYDFVHPEDLSATQKEVEQLASGRTTIVFCNRYRKKDGSYVTLQWYSAADPETGKIYASAMDITTQQQTLEALISAKEAAESAARLKGEFLATMSHEIRTPLNGVMGMLGLLQRSPLSEEQQQRVDIACGSAHALLGIINDILDYSKVDAGKMEVECVTFDLMRLLEETTAPLRYKAEEKGLSLELNTDGLLARFVAGDPGRLRQVLSNLLGNAFKFTHQGSIRLECSHMHNANGELRFIAKVCDTGIGIPQGKLQTLFEPFTQADASTTRKYGGTGLGLAICRKLCQLMDGDVQVSSVYGEGSCFEINVAMKAIDADVVASTKAPALSETDQETNNTASTDETPAEHKAITWQWPADTRLMVVEDNPVNQNVVLSLLREMNLHADVAQNGVEAISMLRASPMNAPYSLILMDCLMPEMDGFEATRHIRSGRGGTRYQNVPIIAVTANAMEGDQERCEAAGMNDYLTKPIAPQRLQRALCARLLPADEIINDNDHPLNEHTDNAKGPSMQNENSIGRWDYEGVVESLGGRREMVAKLIAMFVEKMPSQMKTVQQSMDSNDLASLELVAHSLKGSAAQFKGVALAQQAARLEAAAHAGNWETIRAIHPEFECAAQELLSTFKEFLAHSGA